MIGNAATKRRTDRLGALTSPGFPHLPQDSRPVLPPVPPVPVASLQPLPPVVRSASGHVWRGVFDCSGFAVETISGSYELRLTRRNRISGTCASREIKPPAKPERASRHFCESVLPTEQAKMPLPQMAWRSPPIRVRPITGRPSFLNVLWSVARRLARCQRVKWLAQGFFQSPLSPEYARTPRSEDLGRSR